MLLLRAGELNDREVPDVTEPVLATLSAGLADHERKEKVVSSEVKNNNEAL